MRQVEAEHERMLGTPNASSWGAVANGWEGVGRPFRVAMARWRQAEAADSAGDRQAAIVALRQSFAIATELGAKPLLEHLEVMSRRLRTRLGAPPAERATMGRPYGLTSREAEVLQEVAASRTNREIAERLFISESTAGVHVSHILGKLGVSSRSEAARLARSEGLAGE
jgi:DNA-binding CsgD family transcriptional regulator